MMVKIILNSNDVKNHLKLLKSEKVPAAQASQANALTTVLIKPSGHLVHVTVFSKK
jgi:hypothetical protein